jgi:hypothetical protein
LPALSFTPIDKQFKIPVRLNISETLAKNAPMMPKVEVASNRSK